MRSSFSSTFMMLGGILVSFGAVILVITFLTSRYAPGQALGERISAGMLSVAAGVILFGVGFLLSGRGRKSRGSARQVRDPARTV
jgi:cytochrome c biogenesis protein CcdA